MLTSQMRTRPQPAVRYEAKHISRFLRLTSRLAAIDTAVVISAWIYWREPKLLYFAAATSVLALLALRSPATPLGAALVAGTVFVEGTVADLLLPDPYGPAILFAVTIYAAAAGMALASQQQRIYYVILGAAVGIDLAISHPDDLEHVLVAVGVIGVATFGALKLLRWATDRTESSEHLLGQMFATAPDGILSVTSAGTIVLFNPAAEAIFGYAADEVLGRPLDVLLPDAVRDGHHAHLDAFAAGETTSRDMSDRGAVSGVRKDGSRVRLRITISKTDFDIEQPGFTAVIRDVTAREEEAEQRQMTQRCIAAIATSSDIDEAIELVLREVSELNGWSGAEAWLPDSASGRLERWPLHHSPASAHIVRNPFEGRARDSLTPIQCRHQAGECIYGRPATHDLEALAVPGYSGDELAVVLVYHLGSDHGDHEGPVSSVVEVTSHLAATITRHRAEQARQTSEAINRGMLQAMPDVIARFSEDGICRDVRAPAGDPLGCASGISVGRRIDELLPSSIAAGLLAAAWSARRHQAVRRWEFDQVVDDESRWYESRIVPIPELDEMMVILRDITDRKQSEAELAEMVRSKDQLIASVSHEIRTPLTAVLGFAEILDDPALELSAGDRQDMISSIASEAADMSDIVDDLLVAARADIKTLRVSHRRVAVHEEISAVLQAMRRGGHEHGFDTNVGRGHAIGDSSRIRQILRNLVTNAIRYGGPDRRIDVETRGDTVVVAVRDSGPEISETDGAKMFEAYRRAKVAAGQPGSVGLGLTIARELARLMDGDLIYRHEGGWSSFILSLPAAPTPAPPKEARSAGSLVS